jgi:hypothetical protein
MRFVCHRFITKCVVNVRVFHGRERYTLTTVTYALPLSITVERRYNENAFITKGIRGTNLYI